MSRIGGKDTLPELMLRKALFASGVRGWRVHRRDLPGKPDLAFSKAHLAVFVDGAFWHGHPSKFSPGRLTPPWEAKILRNQERDRQVDSELSSKGWVSLRIWDVDIKRDLQTQVELIARMIDERMPTRV